MKTVAVVGSGDPHAEHVARAVERLGAKALRIDTSAETFTCNEGVVHFGGKRVDQLRCFYVKSVHLSVPQFEPDAMAARGFDDWPHRYVAERERHSLLSSVLRLLHAGGRHFVNPVEQFDLHYLKLLQLELLARAKVRVPASLATSDKAALLAFSRKHRDVIYKPLGGGATVKKLSAADLKPARLAALANAPVLFQEQIQGDEARAYVLAGEPVAAFRVPSHGVVDSREALGNAQPWKIPAAAWKVCVRAAKALGLVFTAVDLRRGRDGQWVVLECNPTPAISFFEDPVDGVVIQALAAHLVAHA